MHLKYRSSYARFIGLPDISAESAARAILNQYATFGVPKVLMSDGPTHLKNEAIRLAFRTIHTPHHVTLLYYTCIYGDIERLSKELI